MLASGLPARKWCGGNRTAGGPRTGRGAQVLVPLTLGANRSVTYGLTVLDIVTSKVLSDLEISFMSHYLA